MKFNTVYLFKEKKMNIVELDQKARQQQIDEEDRAREKAKKNHNFVQFTRVGLLQLSKINAFAAQVFLYLAKEMDYEAKIIVSQETLADIFEVTRGTINIAIKELVKEKMIEIIKVGNSNIYCLNAFVVWNTYHTNLVFAKFKATIIVSKKEQLKTHKLKQITLKNPIKEDTAEE